MSIYTEEFINIAQINIEQNLGEIGSRTAASRAYYGMYHACLELTGGVPKKHPMNGVFKGGSHSKLSQYMTECADLISPENSKEIRMLGVKLKMYHKVRCDADYELKKELTEKSAEVVIIEAKKILSRTAELVKSSVE